MMRIKLLIMIAITAFVLCSCDQDNSRDSQNSALHDVTTVAKDSLTDKERLEKLIYSTAQYVQSDKYKSMLLKDLKDAKSAPDSIFSDLLLIGKNLGFDNKEDVEILMQKYKEDSLIILANEHLDSSFTELKIYLEKEIWK